MTVPSESPPHPLLAARRQWLLTGAATLAAPAWAPWARAANTPRFPLGVASGFPRSDGMVLWTRLLGPDLPPQVEVSWEMAEDENFRHVRARGTEVAAAADAHSVHAEPTGLAPGRPYWYRFTALGDRSEAGRTRTAPARGDTEPLSLVLASCQRWDHGHWAAWRHAVADTPDLIVFVGDYIYEYPMIPGRVRLHTGLEVVSLDQYRARYELYRSDPLLRAAHAAAPWVLTWDDHEVENDYAAALGGKPALNFAARRAAAYQAYWEHQPFPKSAKPANGAMRIYGTLDWGRTARLLIADNRQHRDAQACPKPLLGHGSNTLSIKDCPELLNPQRSLLGPAQESWLAQTWSTEHRWNLLVQQTLMAPLSWKEATDPADHVVWTDGWSGYAPARQRLLNGIAERRVPGAMVLGGDVHAHYVADLHAKADDPRSPVVATEFCGTSISSHGAAQRRLDAIRPFHPHIHYARSDRRGYVHLKLDQQGVLATLRGIDAPDDPDSAAITMAQFEVAPTRPGAQAV